MITIDIYNGINYKTQNIITNTSILKLDYKASLQNKMIINFTAVIWYLKYSGY